MWRQVTGTMLGVAVGLGLMAGSVAAGTFVSASAEVGGNGELRVTATEAEIRDPQAHFIAQATATATYGCRNRGDHTPPGHNAPPVFGVVFSLEVPLIPDARGVATGTMVVPPLAGASSCPPGLTPALVAIQYDRVNVSDDNSGAGIALPGQFIRRF